MEESGTWKTSRWVKGIPDTETETERKTKTDDVPPRLIGFLLILWRDPLRRNLRTIFGNVKQGTLLPCLKKERNGKETSASVASFTMRHIHVCTVYEYEYEYVYACGYGYWVWEKRTNLATLVFHDWTPLSWYFTGFFILPPYFTCDRVVRAWKVSLKIIPQKAGQK